MVLDGSRIIITGPPRTGKTTLSKNYESSNKVFHTDDWISKGWSGQSEECVRVIETEKIFVIEGVAAIRGIRKYLDKHGELPVDHIIILTEIHEQYTKEGQWSMAKGIRTVLDECLARWGNKLNPIIKYL